MSHPVTDTQTEATNSLALLLKQGTQDLHDQAESGPFQQRMVNGKLLREEYVAFLQQVLHVHRAVEPLFRDGASREPRFADMLHENHFRVSKIEKDLVDLGAGPTESVLPSTQRFIDSVGEASKTDPLSLIGVLYVKEGATNGNKIVAKRIREGLGLDESVAMGYMDPHGTDQRRLWRTFKDGLNSLEMSEDEQGRCLNAARDTFRLFMDLSAELAVTFPR
ncbi:MAG: biliverdin-producing heme oxygenase [Planctomycetota bacterium]